MMIEINIREKGRMSIIVDSDSNGFNLGCVMLFIREQTKRKAPQRTLDLYRVRLSSREHIIEAMMMKWK